jgi:CheY-like chemotaxis protein
VAHVLLIDDDADLIEANRTVLEAHGHAVSSALSAEEGWGVLNGTRPPDVIVLDVMMEEFDSGFALANDISIKFPKLPILMLTAVHDYMSDAWRFSRDQDGEWLPVHRFLEKPVSPSQLLEAIADVTQPAS